MKTSAVALNTHRNSGAVMTTSWTSTTGILLSLATSVLAVTASPVAHTLNGTYLGAHLPTWNQDAFLGMPFAQPPLGKLRFRAPQSINETFKGERFATNYGYSCRQFSQATNTSEDCLTVNVVRPAGEPAKLLPVLYVNSRWHLPRTAP